MVEKTKRAVVACWACRDMIIGGLMVLYALHYLWPIWYWY